MNAYRVGHWGDEKADYAVFLHSDVFSAEAFERMVVEAYGEAARIETDRVRTAHEAEIPELRAEAEAAKAEGRWWDYARALASTEIPDEPYLDVGHLLTALAWRGTSVGAVEILIERHGFTRLEYVREFCADGNADLAQEPSQLTHANAETRALCETIRRVAFKRDHAEPLGWRLHVRARKILTARGIDPETAYQEYLATFDPEKMHLGRMTNAELLRALDIEPDDE